MTIPSLMYICTEIYMVCMYIVHTKPNSNRAQSLRLKHSVTKQLHEKGSLERPLLEPFLLHFLSVGLSFYAIEKRSAAFRQPEPT